jgi:hypothetical protein
MAGLPLIAFASKCEVQLDVQVKVQAEDGPPHKSNGAGKRVYCIVKAQHAVRTHTQLGHGTREGEGVRGEGEDGGLDEYGFKPVRRGPEIEYVVVGYNCIM